MRSWPADGSSVKQLTCAFGMKKYQGFIMLKLNQGMMYIYIAGLFRIDPWCHTLVNL